VWLEETCDAFRSEIHALGRFALMSATKATTKTRPTRVPKDCWRNGNGHLDLEISGS
jgi:hypothetical protein